MNETRRVNNVRETLRRGGIASGPTVQLASPDIIEIAGRNGFEFAWIDCEHGSFALDGLVEMLRAADAVGLTAVVRVSGHGSAQIMQVLDAGAMGIVIPSLGSREQARTLLSAARYKDGENGGSRGTCPSTRATWHQTRQWDDFAKWSNANIMVWGTIESVAGVENIDDILQESLDGIALGPFDLAHDMGYPGQPHHPAVAAALEEVTRKALARGIPVIATLFSATAQDMVLERKRWFALGVRIFSIGTDRTLIGAAMQERLRASRGDE